MSAAVSAHSVASRASFAEGADPIDILAAEHAVLRDACARLERIAAAPGPEPEAACHVGRQLRAILPGHMDDEDRFLFPLLRKRAEPEDEIQRVLARLELEHEEGGGRVQEVLAMLDRLGRSGSAASPEERTAISAFAVAKLRHLSLEAAIVLPIARERLSAADRAGLRAAMTGRALGEAVRA
jgi:iron-sulfur cluster repair protein YtfE (RIC family)